MILTSYKEVDTFVVNNLISGEEYNWIFIAAVEISDTILSILPADINFYTIVNSSLVLASYDKIGRTFVELNYQLVLGSDEENETYQVKSGEKISLWDNNGNEVASSSRWEVNDDLITGSFIVDELDHESTYNDWVFKTNVYKSSDDSFGDPILVSGETFYFKTRRYIKLMIGVGIAILLLIVLMILLSKPKNIKAKNQLKRKKKHNIFILKKLIKGKQN